MMMSTAPPIWKRPLAEWLAWGVIMLTLVSGAVAWHTSETRRLLVAEHERIETFANFVANDISLNLVAVNQALAGVIRDRLVDPAHLDTAAISMRLTALAEAMPSVRAVTVMDGSGVVVAGVPADLLGRNFSQREYFTVPRLQGDPATFYLSPPFRSIRGDIVVAASRMVPGRDGRFQGVVTAVLAPRYFAGMLRTLMYAADVRASVAFADGRPFVEISGASGGLGDAMAPPAARALPLLEGLAPLTIHHAIAPANVGMDHSMVLSISRDANAVVAPLDQQARLFAVLIVLAAPGSALALAWSQRRRRLLRRLAQDRLHERSESDALRDSETRFRTLIEEAPVAVAILRAGRFVYTNRRYKLLHGHPPAETMAGLPWRAMLATESLALLRHEEALIGADSPTEQHFEAVGLRSDGGRIPVYKATTRVELGDGPATLIFTQDISAQKRAEAFLLEARDAAEAASRSKAEFLANMSHEIRPPLNAILGLAYLLEQSDLGGDAEAMLLKIRSSGRSLLGIINDVLDVSKIEAGAMTIDRSWFALQDVIDNVAATMGVAVADKPLVLLVQALPRQVASIMGDALRLEQLLVNLTSNAIKFTASGRVELAVLAGAQQGDRLELTFEVRDSGIGIAANQQQSIFAPFTQADSSTTRRYGGSGLGLNICKQLVALMGGQIGVRSTVGVGSVFWFSIPVQCMPAVAASLAYRAPHEVELDIMAAASNELVLANCTQVARSLGWQVDSVHAPANSSAAGAADADCAAGSALLAALRRRQQAGTLPSAIVLECEGDAVDTARAIRAAVGPSACPLVLLTSTFAVASLNADCHLPGGGHGAIDAVLTKPLTASTLYQAVIEARRQRASIEVGALAVKGAAAQLAGLRLLVVDDSEINREVARRILSDQGASVTLADDGGAALAWLDQHPDEVDLVLMDVQMPVMDGIEATRRLRAKARFANLPIVALTAGAFQSHHDAAREAGMSHFITKPFDIPLTIALIRRLTGLQGEPLRQREPDCQSDAATVTVSGASARSPDPARAGDAVDASAASADIHAAAAQGAPLHG
ncbi:ATP-binding protein [Massilia sp. PWRC2]|uniref:ATP-binding protein n=1 Tax=Massilia sp. PWRC2 TaxID=2804626 RepID=UPI003CF24D78